MSSASSSMLMKDPYRYMDKLYEILNDKIDNLEEEVEEIEERNDITFMLNGKEITIKDVDPELSLINYLRDTLHLTGTKVNCNQGFCGLCTVIRTCKYSNGEYYTESVNSCLLKVVNLDGVAINTIESIRSEEEIFNNTLHPIQQYFWTLGALQCGYCTTGFEMKILSSVQSKHALPTFNNITNILSGNICRCTGYRPIIEAYKVLLIAIAENPVNGVSKSDVVGNVNKVTYDNEYDHLLNKWQIGKTHGLPLYDLNNNNINMTKNKQFLDEKMHDSTKVFISEVYDNYKYYIPENLEALDKILLNNETDLSNIYFVNGLTSNGVPGFTEILHKHSTIINIKHIDELYKKSVTETQVEFGAGLEYIKVQELLHTSNNQMFQDIAKNIEYIAGSSVRNLGCFIGGVMMTVKNGFRGDGATMIAGADAKFTYAVYNNGSKDIKSNNTYSQLVSDSKTSQLLLLHTVTITNNSSSTYYRYQRSASRLVNAQSYCNMAIKATKNGTTYTNLLIAVGAINDNGVQLLNLPGPYSLSNVSSLLSKLNSLTIKDEYKFVDEPNNEDSVLNMLKGFVVKYLTNSVDIKDTMSTTQGKQRYDGGLTNNLDADYDIYNLIPEGTPGASDKHVLVKQGALTQFADDTATSGDSLYNFDQLFKNRDQISDYLPDKEHFANIGIPKPQRDARSRVLGECIYASEYPIDAYSSEVITTNCASGTMDLNTPENKALLNKFRTLEGVEAIIVNDDWFTQNIGKYTENDSYNYSDSFMDSVNFFNLRFYPSLLNLSCSSKYTSAGADNSTKFTLNKTIRYYGQIFGMVIAKNLILARYVAEQLTNNLHHIQKTPDLPILNSEHKFIPHEVLNDSNTASRAYGNIFGTLIGAMGGFENGVENNPNAENLIPTGSEFIGGTAGEVPGVNPATGGPYPYGFYRNSNNSTGIVPNFKNEYEQGSFYTNPTLGLTHLNKTVGQSINLFDQTTENNGWLKEIDSSTGEPNVNGIFDNRDLGHYSGTIKTHSQFSGPMEGQAFTLMYETGRVLKCYINSQDSFSFRVLNQVLKDLLPKFKASFYDSTGNFISSDVETVIEVQNLASGGSFGGKFWYACYRQIELLVLSAILTRKPLRYLEYWKTNEGTLVGRPIYQNKVSMSVDQNEKKIKSIISDEYVIVNKDSAIKSFGACVYAWYTMKDQVGFEFANRVNVVELNIGDTQYQRGIMDVEAYAYCSTIFSKASALLKEPYHRLFLKHLNQTEYYSDRQDPDKQKPNITGFKGIQTQREDVFLELETAIVKNVNKENKTTVPDIASKADIINAFDKIYDEQVTKFNKDNKTRKRGMSIAATNYSVMQLIGSGYTCKMHINYNSQIALDIPILDQGTGSFQNAIDVVAEYLKVDTKLICPIASSNLFLNTGMIHAGSVGRVGIPRAATATARKFMTSLFSRYPVHPVYSKLPGNERWFEYPYPLVDRGSLKLPNQGGERKLHVFGIPEHTVSSTRKKVDLRLFTGEQLCQMYDQIFQALNYAGLAYNPFGAAPIPIPEMKNIKAPDLHKELILRTLEYEYSPMSPDYGTTWIPGENKIFAFDLPYYKKLVEQNYTITTQDMMNRWPMIVAYQASAIRIEDRGSFEYPIPFGKGNGFIDGINTGENSAELLGICLGGAKRNHLNPNSYNGHATYVYNGAINGYFIGNVHNLCTVEGNVHDTPTTKSIRPNVEKGNLLNQANLFALYSTSTISLNITEIDVLTGEWVSKYSDISINTDRAINPLADMGQCEGGFEFGVGFSTMENSSNFIDGGKENGKRLLNGHWNYKMSLAKTVSGIFNCTLLNVNDAFRPGFTAKTCGEISTVMGNSVASSIRDAIRCFREEISEMTLESTLKDPFVTDTQQWNRDSCNYMDELCQTPVHKIKKYTNLPDDVLEYYMNK